MGKVKTRSPWREERVSKEVGHSRESPLVTGAREGTHINNVQCVRRASKMSAGFNNQEIICNLRESDFCDPLGGRSQTVCSRWREEQKPRVGDTMYVDNSLTRFGFCRKEVEYGKGSAQDRRRGACITVRREGAEQVWASMRAEPSQVRRQTIWRKLGETRRLKRQVGSDVQHK